MRYCTALFAIPLVACADQAPPSTAAVRDSAGVRIVENQLGGVPEWQLSPTPRLNIGNATDSLASLYQVEGAHRLSDGRVVVANRGTNELRYYSGDGVFLHSAGRKGQGPGEYEYIAWTTRCGTDSIYVYDITTLRLTVIDEAGNVARLVPFMLPDNTLPYGASSCQPGGPFASAGWSKEPDQQGLHRPAMPVGLISLDGAPLRMLGPFPGVDRWGLVLNGRMMGTTPLALGRRLQRAVLMNRVYVGTADTYEVSAYGFDGDLELLIRLIRPNVRLTKLEIDQYIDDEVRRATSDNERRRLRWVYGDMDFPEHLPPYSAFVADADGLLWIQDYPRSGAVEVTWRVFEASGVYVASVKTPNRLRVFEIGGDYVLGLWKDELDVEHVRLYALIKPGQ